MTYGDLPEAYIGREQAYVKHTILKTYLQRLFMIVGQKKESVINYVDCFSGPWQTGDEHLRDTSIGVSLEQMSICQATLEKTFGRKVTFRALYIEKDPTAYERLNSFLENSPFKNIETTCLKGDYTDLLSNIVGWCNFGFTFFFVDPKGWQKVIGGQTLKPLLELPKAEFLINLMYDFINRAINLPQHANDMDEIFGNTPEFSSETPEHRQLILLESYRENLKKYYLGRSAYVNIEKPGKNRIHYCLVYLTRSATGLDVFKTEAEKMNLVQKATQSDVRLRMKLAQTGMMDMFSDELSSIDQDTKNEANVYVAKQYILGQLESGPLLIDWEKWADFLELTDLYPSDFQAAMKELLEEGKVENLNYDVSQRRKKIIKPSWPNKSETWQSIT